MHASITLDSMNNYNITKYKDWSMLILANYFICEMRCDSDRWLAWLNSNHKSTNLYPNWVWVSKFSANCVIMGDITMDTYDNYASPPIGALIIKSSELIKLLEKWKELRSHQAKEIMITKEGNVFEMYEIVT